MADIIVHVPPSRLATFFTNNGADPFNFWTLRRKPVDLHKGDFIWFEVQRAVIARARVFSFSTKAQRCEITNKVYAGGTHVVWRKVDFEQLERPLTKRKIAPSKGFAYMPKNLQQMAASCAVKRCKREDEMAAEPAAVGCENETGLIPDKYIISKSDGTQIAPGAVYFPLRLDSDEDARAVVLEYAERVRRKGKVKLADDIQQMIVQITQQLRLQRRAAYTEAEALARLSLMCDQDADESTPGYEFISAPWRLVTRPSEHWAIASNRGCVVGLNVESELQTAAGKVRASFLDVFNARFSKGAAASFLDLDRWVENAIWPYKKACHECGGQGCEWCEGDGHEFIYYSRPGFIRQGKTKLAINRNLLACGLDLVRPCQIVRVGFAQAPRRPAGQMMVRFEGDGWRIVMMPLRDEENVQWDEQPPTFFLASEAKK